MEVMEPTPPNHPAHLKADIKLTPLPPIHHALATPRPQAHDGCLFVYFCCYHVRVLISFKLHYRLEQTHAC